MKNLILCAFILAGILCVALYPLSGVTVPNTFTSGAKIYASEFNENFDTLETFTTHIADSLDTKYIRFKDLESGDSTLDRLQVDTIRSNPDVDSIKGNPFIDTITTRRVVADSTIGPVRGNVTGEIVSDGANTLDTLTCDTITATAIRGRLTTGNGAINMGTGDLTVDSIYSGKITTNNAAVNTGTGDITTDSVYGRTITLNNGAVNTGTGDITTDSVYARTIQISGNTQTVGLGIGEAPVATKGLNLVGSYAGTAGYTCLFSDYAKTSGATDKSDDFIGINTGLTLNQSGGETGNMYGAYFYSGLLAGTVGNAGTGTKNIYGTFVSNDLDAGTCTGNLYGFDTKIDQEASNTVTGETYGNYINLDMDGTTTGSVYMLYLKENSGVDYGIYQSGTAANVLGGNLSTGTADITTDSVYARTIKTSANLYIASASLPDTQSVSITTTTDSVAPTSSHMMLNNGAGDDISVKLLSGSLPLGTILFIEPITGGGSSITVTGTVSGSVTALTLYDLTLWFKSSAGWVPMKN